MKKPVVIAASILTIGAVGGLSVGLTTALFTEEKTAHVHISSGKLEVNFYMNSIKVDVLDPTTGEIIEDQELDLKNNPTYGQYYVEGKGVDLKQYVDALFTVENVFPSMQGEISLLVVNDSDIAITNEFAKELSGEWGEAAGASKKGTAMSEAELAVFTLDMSVEEKDFVAAHGGTQTAVISFEFDADAGNDYQGCKFVIDTTATATQVTASHD